MLLAASTTVEKLKALPPETWLKAGGGIVVVLAAVLAWRVLEKVNRLWLAIGGTAAAAILFFSTVYYRNEPKWMSPAVDLVAPFLPSAGGYEIKQAGK